MDIKKINDDEYRLSRNSVLKKSHIGKWQIIYPVKIEGKLNWKNLLVGGSFINFLFVILILSLLIFMAWAYARDTSECRDLLENPPTCVCVRTGYYDQQEFDKTIRELNFSKRSDNEFDISISSQNNDKAD